MGVDLVHVSLQSNEDNNSNFFFHSMKTRADQTLRESRTVSENTREMVVKCERGS